MTARGLPPSSLVASSLILGRIRGEHAGNFSTVASPQAAITLLATSTSLMRFGHIPTTPILGSEEITADITHLNVGS